MPVKRVLSNTSKERQQILKFIRDHGISVVIVHELDRLARSMPDTLLFVNKLDKLGVTFISIHDGFDTSTPQGQLHLSGSNVSLRTVQWNTTQST
ncbi:recombinase family protein [Desulfofundulus thermocisternus]|uniref:recombinase family protein n=1 Tax=Desulfofundulus thermocisternus TaxID=42471 RepID=UPI0035C6C452